MKHIFFLFILTACSVDTTPDLDLDFRQKSVNKITTRQEMTKLAGNWMAVCSPSAREIRLAYGQHCGVQNMGLDGNSYVHEFEQDFFDYAVSEKVSECEPSARYCGCATVEGVESCSQLVFKSGQCTLTVEADVRKTVRNTKTGGLFGGRFVKDFMMMKNIALRMNYLDPRVEAAVVPEYVEIPTRLSDIEAAKYSCVRMLRQFKLASKSKRLSYNVFFDGRKLFLFHDENLEMLSLSKKD